MCTYINTFYAKRTTQHITLGAINNNNNNNNTKLNNSNNKEAPAIYIYIIDYIKHNYIYLHKYTHIHGYI